jgi:hypothetical protein
MLLVTGADDDPAFPLQAQRLHGASPAVQRPGASRPDEHPRHDAIAAEPGIEPAPQTPEAKLVDAAVTDWLNRYLM